MDEDQDPPTQPDALKHSEQPRHDVFTKVYSETNEEGHEINPFLLKLLYNRQYRGDGTEDRIVILISLKRHVALSGLKHFLMMR